MYIYFEFVPIKYSFFLLFFRGRGENLSFLIVRKRRERKKIIIHGDSGAR